MSKRTSLYGLIFLVTILMAVSCKKDYLDLSPSTQISQEEALTTVDGCWELLNGMHRVLYTPHYGYQNMVGQGYNMMTYDMMGEDVTLQYINDDFINTYIWNSQNVPTSGIAALTYNFFYEIIMSANLLIDNVDNATGKDADKKSILGQAYAYRAWAYFNLVQFYSQRFSATSTNKGLGVRLTLHFKEALKSRASVQDVYLQIEQDLNNAVDLLTNYTRANKSHLDKSVALGLKARLYLTQENWLLAAVYANLARQNYSLMDSTTYMSGFNNYVNPEWMWGSHQQQNQSSYFASFFAYMSCNFPSIIAISSPRSITRSLYKTLPPSDVRFQLWDSTGTNKSFPVPVDSDGKETGTRVKFMQRKFKVADAGSSIGDVPLMRAAEMYLIEAEALARQGRDDEAASVLYSFAIVRDKKYVKSTKTGDDLLTEILNHRRTELWGEGFRFTDLKRMNLTLDRSEHTFLSSYQKKIKLLPGDKRWQVAIPQTEIDASQGLIVQNPL